MKNSKTIQSNKTGLSVGKTYYVDMSPIFIPENKVFIMGHQRYFWKFSDQQKRAIIISSPPELFPDKFTVSKASKKCNSKYMVTKITKKTISLKSK